MNRQLPKRYYSGLSGLQLPVPKKLYPADFQNASRLAYYSSLFNSIEINSSFYKIPMSRTVAKWSASVGDHFEFTFKLFKEITHARALNFEEKDVNDFLNAISVVENKGCLLIQFPPSLTTSNIHQLDKLLNCVRNFNPLNWKVAVEFRNKGWYNEDTYSLLKSYACALVIQDIPASATPLVTTAEFVYLRFHGPTGRYRDSYTEAFLLEYSEHIKEWLSENKTVYAYFNNTMGDAFNNLVTLNNFVASDCLSPAG